MANKNRLHFSYMKPVMKFGYWIHEAIFSVNDTQNWTQPIQNIGSFHGMKSGLLNWCIFQLKLYEPKYRKLNTTGFCIYFQVFDLPATIDYILSHTNQTNLAFIGVSQGSTALLILLSELPDEYNHKISIAHLITPVAIFKNNKTPFPRSIEFVNALGVSKAFFALEPFFFWKKNSLIKSLH